MSGLGGPEHVVQMPRPRRFVIPGLPHHLTQRGNYRQQTFFDDADYLLYLLLLSQYSRQLGVTIQAYCLMPNRVHLILTPQHQDSVPQMLQRLHSAFARDLHLHHERAGHLWQGRYYSPPMDDVHFWNAMVYVEQNPQRARLVQRSWDWHCSSAAAHIRGQDDGLLGLSAWHLRYASQAWRQYLKLGLRDADLVKRIRDATGKGWPLGSDSFLEGRQHSLRSPSRPRAPGRKLGFKLSDPN